MFQWRNLIFKNCNEIELHSSSELNNFDGLVDQKNPIVPNTNILIISNSKETDLLARLLSYIKSLFLSENFLEFEDVRELEKFLLSHKSINETDFDILPFVIQLNCATDDFYYKNALENNKKLGFTTITICKSLEDPCLSTGNLNLTNTIVILREKNNKRFEKIQKILWDRKFSKINNTESTFAYFKQNIIKSIGGVQVSVITNLESINFFSLYLKKEKVYWDKL